MNIILPYVGLVTRSEQILILVVGPRGVGVAQRRFEILVRVRKRLFRVLIQKLVDVSSAQSYVFLRLLVSFSFPKDQEGQKIGLNHVVKIPPDFTLLILILAFHLQIQQELGSDLLRLGNELHRFNRIFLVVK